jgi:hypothetical protein
MGRKSNLRITTAGLSLKRPNKHTGHKGYGRHGIVRTIRTPQSSIVAVAAVTEVIREAA